MYSIGDQVAHNTILSQIPALAVCFAATLATAYLAHITATTAPNILVVGRIKVCLCMHMYNAYTCTQSRFTAADMQHLYMDKPLDSAHFAHEDTSYYLDTTTNSCLSVGESSKCKALT